MMLPPKVRRSTIGEARIGEGLGPAAEGFVARNRHRGFLLAFGEHLEGEFRAALVQSHVAQFIDLCRCRHRSIYPDPVTMPSLPRRELKSSVVMC